MFVSHLHVSLLCSCLTNLHTPELRRPLGLQEVVTTCSGIITGADGNRHLHVLSSVLSLIGQKLYVSR